MPRCLLGSLVLLAGTCPAFAKPVAAPPVAERLARAELVIHGKVTQIEKTTVKAQPSAFERTPIEYQVAVIKIEEALIGGQGLTHVRVGIHQAVGCPPVGTAACFLLTPHHEQTFYVLDRFTAPMVMGVPDELRRLARLLNEPLAGLKSKNADDRFLTAALLIARYRAEPGTRSEKIPAEESKLILQALRDANWKRIGTDRMSPQQAFSRLGLSAEDGWQPPRDFRQYETTARAWLDKHVETYRIQRFVADKK
ncbi:MAG: hypothetical protein AB7K24_03580 [Gemmataceae bacterium]